MKVRVPMTVEVRRSPLRQAAHRSTKLLPLLSILCALAGTASAQTTLPATLRAADFDQGANGVSYRDTTSGNSGGYYRVTDVDIEACAEGGVSIGWASAGEWLNYTVTVPKAGTYSLDLRVASLGGGRLNVQFGGSNKTGSMSVPATGGWQSWTTISTTVNLSAGVQVMRVAFETDGINFSSIGVGGGGSGGGAVGSAASGGRAFPGTVEAEDFDDGPSGTAYWDSTSGNSGGEVRDTDVDIQSSTEGSYNIGWTTAGEWLNYTLNVESAGSYTLNLRVASTRGGTIYVLFDGTNKTGTMRVPVTGGYQAWTTVSAPVDLPAGIQVMRVVFESGGVQLNSISASSGSSAAPPASSPASSSPFGGSAAAVPGTIQAEGFDAGGSGVAYVDNSQGNSGGAYRATDVDIESGGSQYVVGWISAGEWLQYTVNVAAAGNYVMTARVASAGSGGTFHVETNGQNRGSIQVPDTGAWDNFHEVAATVYLDAGVQQMRVVFDSNGSSGAVGNLDFLRFSTPSSAPAPAPTPPASTGGRLRVLTWNINFGTDPWGQAQVIADSGADVALLQEASLWDEDMRATYPQRLQQLTGQKWYSVFASHSGRYSPNEGTMILSRLPLVDQSTRNAYDRGFSRVLVNVGGVQVNLLNAHLDWPDTNMRSLQLEDFMWWSRQFAGPRIAGGDFNSWWGEYWIGRMTSEYSDTWVDVKGTQENGYTLNGSVRFDYLFRYDPNSRVLPSSIWVTSTSSSDHWPAIADYTVR